MWRWGGDAYGLGEEDVLLDVAALEERWGVEGAGEVDFVWGRLVGAMGGGVGGTHFLLLRRLLRVEFPQLERPQRLEE